jgi:hypothetical protein
VRRSIVAAAALVPLFYGLTVAGSGASQPSRTRRPVYAIADPAVAFLIAR